MLKKAYVEITNRCNLVCSFCPKTKRAPRTMSVDSVDYTSMMEGDVDEEVAEKVRKARREKKHNKL